MQDTAIAMSTQPFTKLAMANMDVFARFATSPEVMSEATASAGQLFQQAAASSMKLMQSGAFASLMQGMLKNYTEFLTEFSQGSMAMLGQVQEAAGRQVQGATQDVFDMTETRRRSQRTA